MYTLEDFLNEYFGCSCDEVGNRSCDNGALCDRCMTDEAKAAFNMLAATHKD